MSRSSLKIVIPCLVALGLAAPAFSTTVTGTSAGFETRSRTVSYADLDLTRGQGVATLYARIKSAAHEVCDSEDARGLQFLAVANRCREQAVGQAVEEVHSSGLTSLHRTASGPAGEAFHR